MTEPLTATIESLSNLYHSSVDQVTHGDDRVSVQPVSTLPMTESLPVFPPDSLLSTLCVFLTDLSAQT
ncbi:unnamed protein product [Camellia sinensis]